MKYSKIKRPRPKCNPWSTDYDGCMMYKQGKFLAVNLIMDPINRSIIAARRRIFLQEWLRLCGWTLVWATAVVAGVLLTDRLFAMAIPVWVTLTSVVAMLSIATIIAWWRRPSAEAIAVMIDKRLGLQDQLGSALYVSSSAIENPMGQEVVSQARQTAQALPLTSAFPIGLTKGWVYVPPAATAVVLLAFFLPDMDLIRLAKTRIAQRAQVDDTPVTKEQVVDQVVTAVQHLTLPESDPDDHLPQIDPVEWSNRLSEIRQNDLSDATARGHAVAELSQLQDQLETQTQRHEQLVQMLENTMSRIDRQTQGPADRFTQAVGRGDFDSAQRAIGDLVEAVESMSDQDRRRLVQQLEHLAQELEQAAKHHAQQEPQSGQQAKQPPTDTGPPPQTQPHHRPADTKTSATEPSPRRFEPAPSDPQVQQRQALDQKRDRDKIQKYCKQLSSSLEKLCRSVTQQRSDNPNQRPSDAPSSQQIVKQLSEMDQPQRQLERLQHALRRTRHAMDRVYQPPAADPGHAERGHRRPLVHDEGQIDPRTHENLDLGHVDGQQSRLLSSGQPSGQAGNVPPTVGSHDAIRKAQQQAQQAVTEDRVPFQYRQTIRAYFDQLPDAADPKTTPSPRQQSPVRHGQ